jgi:hypothetical protein
MSVCHAASIGIDRDVIEYNGPNGAHWRVPISQVKVLGEYQCAQDDRGTLLAIVFDDSGAWLQAPRYAIGADQLLHRFFEHWDVTLPEDKEPTSSGRVLWPAELANEPLINTPAKQLSAPVLRWMRSG